MLAVFAMAAALLVAAPGSVPDAFGAILDVTRSDDPAPDGCAIGDCSLREAVIAANATAANDVINVPGGIGIFTLTILGDGEDAAATGDLDVLDSAVAGTLRIQGDGTLLSRIDALAMEDRVFHVLPGGDLTLNAMEISGGRTESGAAGAGPGDPGQDAESGAGILNEGTLTMNSMWLTNNLTGTGGSGVGAVPGQVSGAGGDGGDGAAIYSTGPVTINASSLFGNDTGSGGSGGNGDFGDGSGTSPGVGGAGGWGGSGAGIYFNAPGQILTINNTSFNDNATGSGGTGGAGGDGGPAPGLTSNGVDGSAGGQGGFGGDGAGIYVAAGSAILSDVTFDLNVTGAGNTGGSGGNGGPSSDDATVVRGGEGGAGGSGGRGGLGGAIFNAGDLTISGASSAMTNGTGSIGGDGGDGGDGGNSPTLGLGGHAGPYGQNGSGGSGIGLYNAGTGDVTDLSVTGNDAGPPGAFGVEGTPGTGNNGNGFPPVNPSIFDMGLGTGGGVVNFGTLTLTDSVVSGNSANRGGGIYNETGPGALNLLRVTVDGNSANDTAIAGAPDIEDGGGLLNVGGDVTAVDSTFSNNFAEYRGGGLSNRVLDPFGAEIVGFIDLKNVTISGNSTAAASQRVGGGIFSQGPTNSLDPMPTTVLNNVTVTDNSAPTGGGISSLNYNNVIVANSIVAGNSVLGAFFGDPAADCDGFTFRSGGNNVIGTLGEGVSPRCDSGPQGFNDGVNGDQVGGAPPGELDAQLGVLQNNGGTTDTHAIAASSPARNAGNGGAPSDAPIAIPGFSDPLPTYVCRASDQTGTPRSNCDTGAFELPAVTLQVGIAGCSDITGAPYCTINTAIGDASSGDTIEILDGVYNQTVLVDKSLTIQAQNPGAVIIDAGAADSVVTTTGGTGVTLLGLRLTNGSSTTGGGVRIGGSSAVTIKDSQIADNVATGAAGRGGAIFVPSGSSLLLDAVSVTGNTAERGAGIYVENTNPTGVIIRSSTFDANTAVQEGGAIYQQLGSVEITNATVTGNSASTGVAFFGGGTTTIRNTVVAANTSASANPACNGGGTITSLGQNFISRVGPACAGVFTAPGDVTGTVADPENPLLGPLQNNGGVGLSRVPQSDSPLIDAADNTLAGFTDVLGNPRVVDGIADGTAQADIGAVELDPLTVCSSGCDFTTVDGPGGARAAAVAGDVIRLGAESFGFEFFNGNIDLTLQGSGADVTVVDADFAGRVAEIHNGASVTIRDLTLTGGRVADSGAGVGVFDASTDLTMERVRVSGNAAGTGGGIHGAVSTAVTVIESLVDANEAAGVFTLGALDQQFLANPPGTTTFCPGNALQSFLPTADTLSRVTLRFRAGSGNVTLQVREGGSEGPVIGATSVFVNAPAMTNVDFDFTPALSLTPATTYVLEWNQVASAEIGSDYPDGQRFIRCPATTVPATPLADDYSFTTYAADPVVGPGTGGGIHVDGDLFLANSTVTGNSAADDGGGIYNTADNLVATATTIAFNTSASGDGGGIANTSPDSNDMTIVRTILANNTSAGTNPDCYSTSALTQATFGPVIIGIDGPNTCENLPGLNPDLQTGTAGSPLDPSLDALADNGGPTLTHALQPGSPALDQGGTALCQNTDQRGISRPQGPACDIGAFELVPVFLTLQQIIDIAIAGDGTAEVPPGTYVENITINGDVSVIPDVPGTVTIDGGGTGTAVAIVSAATVDISDLTVTNGSNSAITIGSDSNLTLTNVDVNNSTSPTGGGGIDNNGTLNMVGGSISNNTAPAVIGGGLNNQDTATLDGVTVSNNATSGGNGGGIHNTGFLQLLNNTVVAENTAGGGPGVYNSGQLETTDSLFTGNGGSVGGAIYNTVDGNVIAVTTDFNENYASNSGGAIWNDGGDVDITDSLFQKNHASGTARGGAIDSSQGGTLTIDGTDFLRNMARFGGAIYTVDDTTITNSLFEDNASGYDGNSGGFGGAIGAGTGESGQVVDITNTDFTNNVSGRSFTAPVVDQDNIPGTTTISEGCSPFPGSVFQGFVPTDSQLEFVRLRVRTDPIGPGGFTIGLRIRDGGPQGNILATFDGFLPGPAAGGPVVVQANLKVPLAITPGNLYVIEVYDFLGATIFRDTADPYPAAQSWVACGGGGGTPLSQPNTDYDFQTGSATPDTGWDGGAIDSATGSLTVTGGVFTANRSSDTGGAINATSSDAVISGATFDGNSSLAAGGALYLTGDNSVSASTFTANSTDVQGGAIAAAFGTLDVADSTFDGNSAKRGGGVGGTAEINVSGSTFVNNFADAVGPPQAGAAIFFNGGGSLVNSTLTGNSTDAGAGGAGVAVDTDPVSINNTTIVDNTADIGAAGIAGEGLVTLANSIVANNTSALFSADCSGVTSLGGNVTTDVACGGAASDQVVADPLIGALADNTGPTETRSLLGGSPAIDAGNTPLDYPVFDNATLLDFQLNGSADGTGGELQLADGAFNVGTAFVTDTVRTTEDFASEFQFRIVPDAGGGADGLTFAISDTPTALGQAGGFLGIASYDPIDDVFSTPFDGVAIEFDTWLNGDAEGANDAATGDEDNHVGINLVGPDPDTTLSSIAFAIPPGTLSDGSVWTAWIDYDAATTTLEVRANTTGTRPAAALVSAVVDIAALAGPDAYVGFTGATGSSGISGEQRIINFSLSGASACAPADQRGVARPQGPDCDAGAFELSSLPQFTFGLNSAPIVPSGASTIKTTDLPSELATAPTDPTDPTDDNIASAPVANLDTQSTDLEASPVANLPVANLDVVGAPVANLPVANLPADAQAVIDSILLTEVPIEGGWEVHLAASTTGLAGRPIQNVTFGQAMADPGVLGSLNAAGLTFNDINVASTPVANLTISGLALGATPVANLPLDQADTTPGEILTRWCNLLAAGGSPIECSDIGINNPASGDDQGYSVASLTIVGADISTLPVANIPVANLPVANLPVANLPVANLILVDSPVANLPVANLPVANLPVANLPVANLPVANLPVANLPVANIPVANLTVNGTPVANLPVANLPVANIGPDGLPVANLPVANLPVANIAAGLIDCSQPAVFDCAAPGATVANAWAAGVLVGSVLDWAVYITFADLLLVGALNFDPGVEFATNVLGDFLELGQITLGDLVGSDFGGMLLGQLLQAIIDAGLGFDFFLGDILLLLVNPEDYPWEDLELDGVNLQEFDLGGGNTTFSAEIEVTSGAGSPASVQVDLPPGWLFQGVSVLDDGGTPVNFSFTQSGQSVVVNVAAVGNGTNTFNVSAAASLSVGAAAASATADVGGVVATSNTVVQVAEVLEPNDVPEDAFEADEDTLYLTHIATEGDIDMYAIPDVVTGSRLSVILSDMAADFDLVLYQPELPPLRPGGVEPEGIATGVSDPGGFIDGDDQIQHEVTGDFPRAFFAATGEPLSIYETSTQLGLSDEVITTATLQAAGTYYVQVHGSNGATSPEPYALRVEVIEPPSFLACSPGTKPFDGDGVSGAVYTAGPGPYNSLILFNEERFGDFYGATAASDLRTALEDLSGQNGLGVNAILVPVDGLGIAALDDAYDDWDADRCNPLAANAVAAQIGQVVDDYRDLHPTIDYVTVIGGDDQIPFFRVPDRTEIANESEYALSISQGNNELVGSLLGGFILTDDPYGDAHPLLIDGRELYVSEVALGRLVETPAQILQSLAHFTQFNGRLDPATTSTGLSTGYDFIEDAAIGIQQALDGDPRRTTSTLNTDSIVWSSQDLADEIDVLGPDVLSLGAHMAHNALLSAAEDLAGTQADLYSPVDAQNQNAGIFENVIIFSMGCHSGLNVPAVQVSQPIADWPDTFSELGAVYVGETGFGYGDTDLLAYGEELMRQFAARINGSMTAGQAMQFAKHFHVANLSQFSPYDEKVVMETVMYGLPFYAVGDPTAPPPAPPILPSGTDAATGLTVVSTSFDFGVGAPGPDGEFVLETGSTRGDFYTADGEAQVTPFHPIQPKGTVDVTQPGLVGTGVFIEELSSQDIPNFDPVFSRPTVDLSAVEPERSLPGTFPLVLPGINAYLDQGGSRDQLVVVLGQFTDTDGRGKVGVERLFTHVKANVLFGDPSDKILPTIESVRALDNGSLLTFDVNAYDTVFANGAVTKSDVARVYVLYKLVGASGPWSQLDLTDVGNRWVGAVPAPGAKVEFLVQAIDFNGLVAFHSNKTSGNVSQDIPAPQPGGIDITVTGNEVTPGVYNSDPVTIEIIGAQPGTPLNIEIDGGGSMPYTGPVQVSGEGPHTVTVDGGPGTTPETVVFVIDTQGPEIFVASPIDGALYESGSALQALFSCTDAGAGVATCTATLGGNPVTSGASIDTTTPGTYTLEVASSDVVGNSAVASVTFEVAEPAAIAVTPLLVALGESVTASVAFSPSSQHGHVVTFDWGDGSVDVCPTAGGCSHDESTGVSELTHTYAETGVYNVTATVAHGGGATQVVQSDFVVVFDPAGGFVTGGGWFDTPFGAFTPQDPLDPEVTGRAHFGFVSKYKKGKTVPEGNTTFRLQSTGFRFESDTYDWLVVTGDAKATFQGIGEIIGWNGLYQFKIVLRDADPNPNDAFTEDSIRVIIWQDDGTEDGWIIYDNGYGEEIDSPQGGTQPIGGGSIVIHAPKGGGGKGPR